MRVRRLALRELVDRDLLRLGEVDAVLLVEGARERVAVGQSEDAPVDRELGADEQVVHRVERVRLLLRNAMPLDEHALGDAAVLHLRLSDVHLREKKKRREASARWSTAVQC